MSPAVPTLADRLNACWDACRRPDGREYSTAYVARHLDVQVSPQYLARLRAGQESSRSPGGDLLLALATFWDVPVQYFLRRASDDQAAAVDVHRQLLERAEMHNAGGMQLLHDFMRLSDDGREILRELARLLVTQQHGPASD